MLQAESSVCEPNLALASNVLSDNNESLWEAQTVRHPVSHPVLHTVYQTNVAEQWARIQPQLGSIKAQFSQIRQLFTVYVHYYEFIWENVFVLKHKYNLSSDSVVISSFFCLKFELFKHIIFSSD